MTHPEPLSRQLVLDLPARKALGREDYYVSGANQLAVAMIEDWTRWPLGKLALVGPASSGKTHLAHVWAAMTDATLVGVADLVEGPEAYLTAKALVVEDIDTLEGLTPDARGSAEEALFHLHNALAAQGGFLLVTSHTAPARMTFVLPDLASRLRAATVVDLPAPDDELLGALLRKLAEDRRMPLAEPVLRFLLPRMERSFDGANRLVAALDDAALALKRPVTVPLATQVLERL